ncbi:MAG: phenylacetate--CoA ligase family protein [Promethearchaeota archaeon]
MKGNKPVLFNFLNNLLYHSPLPPYNPHYFLLRKEIKKIQKLQFLSRDKLNRYHDYFFRKLILHCYNEVPFYRKWFKEKKIFISEIKSIKDIRKLPIINKKIIRNNFKDFISKDFKYYNPQIKMTSGSSGIPFKFLRDFYTDLRYNASIWRILKDNGIKYSHKRATLRGNLVQQHGQENNSLWRYGVYNKTIEFNTFHMNEENCKKIINKILEYRPNLLLVYPMSLFILSKHINKYNLIFPSLKLILSSSEAFNIEDRNFMRNMFECPLLDFYGQGELVLSAYECIHLNGYHVVEENNILELLDRNNEEVSEGETGKIIGTNLFNYSMPFIRYETEDLGIKGESECACGRYTKKLKSIEGRILDQIITEDKGRIPGISFYHYWKHRISEYVPNITYVQIIQPKINELIVKLIPNKNYSKRTEEVILKELKKLVGNLNISFEYLNERPKDLKWRFTISKIPKHYIF